MEGGIKELAIYRFEESQNALSEAEEQIHRAEKVLEEVNKYLIAKRILVDENTI